MRVVAIVSLVILLRAAVVVPAQDPPQPKDLLAASTLDFGLDLYRVVKSKPKNVIISPYSITTALAMARSGAAGETARQIDRALRYPRALPEPAHQSLRRALRPREKGAFKLNSANALWLAEDIDQVNSQFLGRLDKWFDAPDEDIDFRKTEKACQRINRWVEKKTLGLIADIVSPQTLTPDTRFCLANALYFKASWRVPFYKSETRERPFHRVDGTSVTARFMPMTCKYGYAEDRLAQVLEVPFVGDETSMVVVLPRKRGGLAELEKSITADTLRAWLAALRRRQTELWLPPFRFASGIELVKPLKKLGMTDAFGAKADFTKLTRSEPLSIDTVRHKAVIEVNEKGATAAAATIVSGMYGGTPRTEVHFTADHPFLFLIRHVKTGTILFIGCVQDPTKGV